MPTVRYRIRNEYGLADPEVYRAADKDDPEALLEGVAMAGLVGLLRQLGDLAEFAAEVFHDLHEEVMATSARGHGLMLRVQQLEAEFPSIEKALLSQSNHSSCAYSEGIDWHANIRVDQNLVTQGDMPRFILDSYEECRGPPRLFMLDKFDVAGAGACLTRYSDPSYFKTASASSEIMESELQREKRARKLKKKGSDWRSGEMADSFLTPIIAISHHIASEPAPDKFLARPVRLKRRNLRSLDIGNRKSYMESLLKEELLVQNDLKISLIGSHIKTRINWNSEAEEVLVSRATDSSLVRKEVYHMSPKEEVAAETISMLSGASQKLYPNYQNAKQKAVLVGLGNRMGKHAFDLGSDENDSMLPVLQLTEKNNLLVESGLITDDDHGGYGSDDIGSELENFVDALNTMESETETDSERRAKSDAGLFNSESRGTNPGFNGQLELQPEFPESGLVESFDKSKYTEKLEDGTPVLSQSTTLVYLHPQLQKRTADKETSCLEIDQIETGEQERTGEALELISSANSTFNETCYEKQSNANTLAPVSEGASSNPFTADSVLNPKRNSEEAQSLSVPSADAFFSNTESTPDVSHHIESSFLPWKTNHVASPTYNEPHDIPSDIIEEINPREHCEDRISATLTDTDNIFCDFSEDEHDILPEKDPVEFLKGSPLTTVCDEAGKPLMMLVHDTSDCISESMPPMIPIGGTFVQESPYFFNELEIDMQSEDLPKKTYTEYIVGSDEPSKQLDSSLQFPAETHGLPLIASNDIVYHESTQNSENVYYDLEHLSDERGAPSGSRDYLMKDQFSGDAEKIMVNDMASLFQMSKPPQKPPGSSFQEVSTIYVKDSLHNSMVKNNETYSVEKLPPSSSAFSLEIDSSIPQSGSLDVETRNISTTKEELVPPQSPASSGNVDIIQNKASIFTYIPNQLEHFSDAEEPQQFASIGTGEPPPSDCGEDPGVNPVLSELVETNGKEHFTYALEVANGSTKLSLLCDQLQLEESAEGEHLLTGNDITEDCMYIQGLHILQSAKVPTFDVHLQEDPLPEKDTYKPKPSIEEPAITRDSTSLQPENKSVMPFAQDLEILFSTVSINDSSVLDLSDPSDAKLVGLKVDLCAELPPNLEGDKISSRENEHDSDLKSENFTTEDVLSLLQSSNVCSLDVPLQKGAVSEDAVLNQCMLDVEELDTADSVSKSENVITEVCADGQVLSLLQSSYLSSFDAMFQEDPVSEDDSLNQLMPEMEKPVVKSELTSLKFASKLFVPLTKNDDQEESVHAVSSSQFLALDSSNFTDDILADDTFGDIHIELDHVIYEENFICSREDEQGTNSKASVLHFQAESPVAEAERSEVQSEQTSVTEAVDEPSKIHLYGGWVNIKPSDTHFYELCADERTNILNKLEHEVVLPEPEHETLLNHGRNNELNMLSSKTDEWEEIKTDPSFVSPCAFEHTGSSTAFRTSASGPCVADFIIPTSITSIEEPFQAFSSSQLQKDVVEAPPLPPLPPLQWRTAKPQRGSLTTGEHMISVMETNPITLPSNAGSLHVNFLPPSKEEIDQHTLPTRSPSALEKRFQCASSITDGHIMESLECSELPPMTTDYWQELEIQFPNFKTFHSSDHSLTVPSKEDGKHAHGNIAIEAENSFTTAPSLKNVNLQHPDLFKEGKPQAIEEKRPKLVKLLPGLELERSQEASVMDADATLALGSFLFMPTAGDGKYQYAYGDYEGETMHHHNLSAPFPVAFRNVPHYGYHMFLREGNSSIYDIMLPEMEGDQPYGKTRSIRNRPRDPLIEAVAAHDKSKLRKVSELDPPKPAEDERNYLLEQIKNKSFNLKPAAAAKPNLAKAPSTNLKVAAILEKANAVRQACVGSDEDDSWSDS